MPVRPAFDPRPRRRETLNHPVFRYLSGATSRATTLKSEREPRQSFDRESRIHLQRLPGTEPSHLSARLQVLGSGPASLQPDLWDGFGCGGPPPGCAPRCAAESPQEPVRSPRLCAAATAARGRKSQEVVRPWYAPMTVKPKTPASVLADRIPAA